MNISFGKTKQTTQQQQKSQTDPWDVAIPYVTDLLKKTQQPSSQVGPTTDQAAAYDQLKTNAKAGNPYAGDIDTLTKDLFGSTTGSDAYADLNRRLSPVADGTNQDIGNDPYLQNLLKTISDDVQWRTNRTFAGAGRDLSGINQQAVARGVTQAQAPILVDQLNKERARSDAAARDLFAGSQSSTSFDADMRKAGIETGKEAIAARDQGANTIIDLEEQMKRMPYEELSWLAELLYPAAGLGQQSSGSGTSTTKGTSMGAKADLGSALAALLGA
jgi:hypothetical protein